MKWCTSTTVFSQIEAAASIYFSFKKWRICLRAASINGILCNNLVLSNLVPALQLIRQMTLLGSFPSKIGFYLILLCLHCGLYLKTASIRESSVQKSTSIASH